MAQLTYYVAPWDREREAELEPDVPEWHSDAVRWGYTLRDLDQFARMAASRCRGQSMSERDKYETAFSAIAENLLTAAERPAKADLIQCGANAVSNQHWDNLRVHGKVTNRADEKGLMPRFPLFWRSVASVTLSHEDGIVERAALLQIWPFLSMQHQRILATLAACGSHEVAAESLGYSRTVYRAALSRARRAFLAIWHEGETPSGVWGRDVRRGASNPTAALRRREQRKTGAKKKTWNAPIPPEKIAVAVELRAQGKTWREIARVVDTSYVGIRRVALLAMEKGAEAET